MKFVFSYHALNPCQKRKFLIHVLHYFTIKASKNFFFGGGMSFSFRFFCLFEKALICQAVRDAVAERDGAVPDNCRSEPGQALQKFQAAVQSGAGLRQVHIRVPANVRWILMFCVTRFYRNFPCSKN
jgi:hypothetical protein